MTARTLLAIAVAALILCLARYAAGVPKPTLGPWKELGDFPIRGHEAMGTLMMCNGEMHHVVFGGFDRFPDFKLLNVTYDGYKRNIADDANPWVKIAPMPNLAEGGSAVPLTHMGQVVRDDVIYLAGGYAGAHAGPSAANVFYYNCTQDKFHILPDLPARRAGGGLVLLEQLNILIFAGGGDRITPGDKDGVLDLSLLIHVDYGTTWMLQLNLLEYGIEPQWIDIHATMPDPRNHQGGVVSCDRYFWIGGQYDEDEITGNRNTCNELVIDPEMGATWKNMSHLPKPIGHISASTMPYKCGIITVGGVSQEKTRLTDIFFWDPDLDKWHTIGQYPLEVATPVCGIHEQRMYCATAGGDGKNKSYVADIL